MRAAPADGTTPSESPAATGVARILSRSGNWPKIPDVVHDVGSLARRARPGSASTGSVPAASTGSSSGGSVGAHKKRGSTSVSAAAGYGRAAISKAKSPKESLGSDLHEPLLEHRISRHVLPSGCGISALKREPFGRERRRALVSPQRALETLMPWGELHLEVVRARGLLAMNDMIKSDPYVEIFLNDVLVSTSHYVPMTLAPSWQFKATIGVFSPKSVVRIALRNFNLLTTDNRMGFVEFLVGDLSPSPPTGPPRGTAGEEEAAAEAVEAADVESGDSFGAVGENAVAGWFELRHPRRFEGLAETRCRAHARLRDDERYDSQEGQRREQAEEEAPDDDGRCSCFAKASRGAKAAAPRPANAGEAYVRLRLEANPDDEWYAFCLPAPHSDIRDAADDIDHEPGHVDIIDLVEDVREVKELLVGAIRPFVITMNFILSWRWPPLSAAYLLYVLVVIWRPMCLLPSLPLGFALWLLLMRAADGRWRRVILAHEETSPLDNAGYWQIASFMDSQRMRRWLERVIEDKLRGEINDRECFESFAALAFRDGRPVFLPETRPSKDDDEDVRLQRLSRRRVGSNGSSRHRDESPPATTSFGQLLKVLRECDWITLKKEGRSGRLPFARPSADNAAIPKSVKLLLWFRKSLVGTFFEDSHDVVLSVKLPLTRLVSHLGHLIGDPAAVGLDADTSSSPHFMRSVSSWGDWTWGFHYDCALFDVLPYCFAAGVLLLVQWVLYSLGAKVLLMLACTVALFSQTPWAQRVLVSMRATHLQRKFAERRTRKWAFLQDQPWPLTLRHSQQRNDLDATLRPIGLALNGID